MTFRSRKLLDSARDQPCVQCGTRDGTTVGCHYTGVRRQEFGGGLGIKVSDFMLAHLCARCHREMDTWARCKDEKWEHSERFLALIARTWARWLDQGVLEVK
jgi:hypothetical protein